MKKFTSLLIGVSLALAGAAFAQQPEEQASPKKEKPAAEKTQPAEPKPPKTRGANLASPEATASKQTGAMKEPGATNEPGAGKGRKAKATEKSATATGAETNVSGQPTAGGNAAVKADPQKVQQVKQQAQQIKQQHANFRAQPRPDKVPAVTFNASYRIQGSDRWQGPQYEVFRSYHPERHDRNWYHSRYQRVELIGGGYYYWNNGYWYPAWGYDPGAEYYAYDAPIYVGHRAEPPDRVIADVQAELQQMGYYRGEVDGLLGPLTRQALTAYQADQGLQATAVIDEPTLDSLGMS